MPLQVTQIKNIKCVWVWNQLNVYKSCWHCYTSSIFLHPCNALWALWIRDSQGSPFISSQQKEMYVLVMSTQLKPHGKTLSSGSVRDLYLVSQSVGFSVLSSGRWTDCSTICGESDFSQNIFQFLSQSTTKLLGTSEPAKQGPSWGGSLSVKSKQLSVQYFGCQWCPPPAAYIAVLQDVAH